MTAFLNRIGTQGLVIVVGVMLLATAFLTFYESASTKSVTARFDRTVSIYLGSEVRVMGVNIGTVTAVIPDGDGVRVEMEYDEAYKIPADAKAAIITPTLVADRFVQLAPAYTGGPVMADGAKIAQPDTATPVELDRIYSSLSSLTKALGPNGANKKGALNELLEAGDLALAGNGELGNDMIRNLSAAVETFSDNSGQLFDTVESMSRLTGTLAANDRFVSRFMSDLAGVSEVLSGERDELEAALASLAKAIGVVKGFVKDNKGALTREVKQLTRILGVAVAEKESLETMVQLAPLGLGNLAIGGDSKHNSMGARVQLGPVAQSLDLALCDVLANGQVANADVACALLKEILRPVMAQVPDIGAGFTAPTLKLGNDAPAKDLEGLVGQLREANR